MNGRLMNRHAWCAAFVLAAAAGAAWADARLASREQMLAALAHGGPCCVIDGRGADARSRHPLADALAYRADLRIVPTSPVVVLADDNRAALAIAQALARQHPGKTVLAVDGGVAVWEALLATRNTGGLPATFVIPSNTCEQGKPLQELRTAPRP